MSVVDIVILVLLLIFVLVGIFKGVFKLLSGILGFVGGVIIASLLLGVVADFLMDLEFVVNIVNDNTATIAESLGSLDITVNSMSDIPEGSITSVLASIGIPEFIASLLSSPFTGKVEAIIESNPGLLLSQLTGTAIVRVIVEVIAFILLLILVCVLISIICKTLDKVFRKFAFTKLLSAILGMAVNFMIGLVLIMAVCWLVADVIKLGVFSDLATESVLLKWILEHNFITALATGGDVAATLGEALATLPDVIGSLFG